MFECTVSPVCEFKNRYMSQGKTDTDFEATRSMFYDKITIHDAHT